MGPSLYEHLAGWWPLLSPPDSYDEEADDLLPRIRAAAEGPLQTLLELGSGGGSLAFHLKRHFRATLTDRSRGMLEVSRAVNPECEHLEGDMRTLRLGRTFDVVLIHDAIMYATDPDSVRAALATAAAHLRKGGAIAVLPDAVRESFQPGTDCGGHDGQDGRALRYLEWTWDPDPTDCTYLVDYAFVMRHPDGSIAVEHDRHIEGLFGRDEWLGWFAEAGLEVTCSIDPWRREIFIGSRREPRLPL